MDHGSYSTVDGRHLHSCRKHAVRASSRRWSLNRSVTHQRVCDECLNLVNRDPHHSTAKRCKINTLSLTEHDAALIVARCTVFQSTHLKYPKKH